MIHYIIQVLLFQTLFLAVYDLFLKKETFFQWNRAYLIITSLLAYAIPFIKIKSTATYIQQNFTMLPEVILNPEIIFLNGVNITGKNTNYLTLENGYYLGIAIASLLFIYKIALIFSKIYKNEIIQKKGYNLVILPKQKSAFSFFTYLFLGKSIFEQEHQHIIKHELTHIKEKHSLDLMYFELQKIVFWFNPYSYLFQSRIAALHEFIADQKTIKQEDKTSFFENLLQQTFQVEKFTFINQYKKKSLLKKRIIMVTKNKSKEILKWKYLLVIPISLFMLAYTNSFSQEQKQMEKEEINYLVDIRDFIQKKRESISSNKETKSMVNSIKKDISGNKKGGIQDSKEKLKAINNLKINYAKDTITPIIETEEVLFAMIENPPVYPGCENNTDKKKCMSNKITKLIAKNFNIDMAKNLDLSAGRKKISVQFKVDKNGNVTNIKARAPHAKLQAEAIRIMKLIPKMKAGIQKGKPVTVRYNLPIIFNVEGDIPPPPPPIKTPIHPVLKKEMDKHHKIFTDSTLSENEKRVKQKPVLKKIMFKMDSLRKIEERNSKTIKSTKHTESQEDEEVLSFSIIEEVPIYKGCENTIDKRKCMSKKITKHVLKNFNIDLAQDLGLTSGLKRISVQFKIDKNGEVNDVIARAPHPRLQEEAIRIMKLIPKMKPGFMRGKPVAVRYNLPINFNVEDDEPIAKNVGTINGFSQNIVLKKKDLKNAIIQSKNGIIFSEVLTFRFKAPGKPTLSINGNKLTRKAINYIKKSEENSSFIIFDIQTKDPTIKTSSFPFELK